MKECFKCNKVKPLQDFYKHPKTKDRRVNKCKECTKKVAANRFNYKMKDPEFREMEKARHRGKYHRLNYKEKHKQNPESKRETIARYRSAYPEKYKAKNKSQRIIPQNKGNHLHHWSYRKEHAKDVIELKPETHYTAHRFLEYDREQMMYRTAEGELLDSKIKHLRYLVEKIKSA